jgi:hypothetical protein
MTARAPCGFDSASNIPRWAQTPLVAKWLADPGFPGSYLADRANKLGTALQAVLQTGDTSPATVDQIASYAVRMLLVSGPNCKGTTFNWLPVLLHYGHTVSGDMTVATNAAETVLSGFETTTNLLLSFAPAGDRSKPNSRWLAGYTKGIMDVDALRDFVYGELYIPLLPQATGATPANMTRAWRFPAGMQTVVADFASNFAKPFWGSYHVNGNARTAQFRQYTITETLTGTPTPDSYAYTISGIDLLSALASFAVTTGTNGVTLTWTLRFQSSDPAAIVQLLTWSANAVQQMTASLKGQFAPA